MFKINNLSVKFKKNKIIKINSFSFPQKGLVIIKGANGSGKTTLFKAMMNIIHYEGDIYYNDINIKEYKEDLYKKVCYIDQFGNLLNYLTEKENYSIIKDILKFDCESIYNERKLNKLSGGQRKVSEEKRIDISSYETFLLDEPTISLDKKHKCELIDRIKEISKEKLVIIITHEIELFKNLAIVYDIDKLENEISINNTNAYVRNNYAQNYSFFKIILFTFLKNIFVFVFLSLFIYTAITLFNLLSYRSSDFCSEMIDELVFVPIEKKEYVDSKKINEPEENNPTRYKFYHNAAISVFHKSVSMNKKLYLNNLEYIYLDSESDDIRITDAISYHVFGDYLNHTGESFSCLNRVGEKRDYIISETIDTIFDEKLSSDDFELIGVNLMYVVLPQSEKTFISDDFSYYSPAIRFCDEIPNNYVSSFFNLDLLQTTQYVKKQIIYFGIYTVFLFMLLIYSFFIINFKNKKQFSDIYKMKSLGFNYKTIKMIYDFPFLITSILSFLIGMSSYIYLDSINNMFEAKFYMKFGLFVKTTYYPILFIAGIIVALWGGKTLVFNKKLGVSYEIRNKKSK